MPYKIHPKLLKDSLQVKYLVIKGQENLRRLALKSDQESADALAAVMVSLTAGLAMLPSGYPAWGRCLILLDRRCSV